MAHLPVLQMIAGSSCAFRYMMMQSGCLAASGLELTLLSAQCILATEAHLHLDDLLINKTAVIVQEPL